MPSLIERAAEVYDFRTAMRMPELSPAPRPDGSLAKAEVQPPSQDWTPAFSGERQHIDLDRLREMGFITPDGPAGTLAEEFRIVKRQLLLNASGGASGERLEKGRMILVCSAQPDEGKTFCAVNLALSLAAERDTDVLLVDADFAKPEILSTLGLEGGAGLMDALADPAIDLESLIIRTDIAKLAVLPAGRATRDDTELLASARTRDVLKDLADRSPDRIVIFDSAPALAASPASVLALNVGQVMMVVRADRTTESELRDALSLLEGCRNVSLLLNGASYFGSKRKFGSYYGHGE